jgi:hypothetical protein
MNEAFIGNRVNAIMQNEAFLNRLMEQMKVPQFIANHEKKTGKKLNESQLKTYHTKVVTEFVSKTNNRFNVIGKTINEQLLKEFDPLFNFKSQPDQGDPLGDQLFGNGPLGEGYHIYKMVLGDGGQWQVERISSIAKDEEIAKMIAQNTYRKIKASAPNMIVGIMPVGMEPRSPKDEGFVNVSPETLQFDDFHQADDPNNPKPPSAPKPKTPPPLPQRTESMNTAIDSYVQQMFNNKVNSHYITEYVTAVEYATKLFEKQTVVLDESEIKGYAVSLSKKKLSENQKKK